MEMVWLGSSAGELVFVTEEFKNLQLNLVADIILVCVISIVERLMSKVEKLAERLKTKPKDFTWDELVKLLHNLVLKM